MFHLVSLSLQISLVDLPGLVLLACVWVLLVFVFFGLVCLVLLGVCFQGNLISILLKIPVVDRPCLSTRPALQEKKHIGCYGTAYVLWVCTHVGWSETAHVLWVFTHV